MSIVNSNNFLHKTVDGVKQFFSPLVNAATVVLKDGTRLEKDGKIHADTADDSKKLNGKTLEEIIPSGGTAGQVLTKNSDTDGDASWLDNTNGLQMDVIWTNEAPSSDFPENTYTIPGIGDYKLVIACYFHTAGHELNPGDTSTAVAVRGRGGWAFIVATNRVHRRLFSITETQLIFDECQTLDTYGSSMKVANDRLIPQVVYGIK